jgi:hypothetical protein
VILDALNLTDDRAIMKLKHQSINLASLYLNMTFSIARALALERHRAMLHLKLITVDECAFQ